MSSPVPVLPPAGIGLYWTEEQLFMYLKERTKGFPIRENENVTADVNPYQHMPSNLPDIWFFISSEKKKDSEHGFWKARGEACVIFTNSDITGWRSTLEFYEGPHGRRTNWVMQEYRITQKGQHSNSNTKESSLLCRVFLSSGASPNQEKRHKLDGVEIAGGNNFRPNPPVVPDTGSTTRQGCMTKSQARNRDDNTGPLAAAGGLWNIPVENMLDIDYITGGDFLELADLADPESRSSSSDNTSCLTITSDECFDSLALLRDLEDAINKDEQRKDADVKFNVAASVRPNEVVMHPPTLEPLVSSNGRKSPAKALDKKLPDKRVLENAIKRKKAGNGNEGTSNSHKVPTSSRSDKAVPEGEKKAQVGRMKKLKKKYFCFMPF